MNFDGKRYDFSDSAAGIADFTALGEADRNKLLCAGMDLSLIHI